jgi:hypothetical protein
MIILVFTYAHSYAHSYKHSYDHFFIIKMLILSRYYDNY